MGIIAWILLGLVAGVIAKAIMPGDDPGGVIVTAVLGIVGALIGGFIWGALFDVDVNDNFFDLATWIAAIVGALIVLAAYRMFAGAGGRRRVAR